MKTAEEWILKSEPAMPLAPALTKTIIKAIQADALREAAEIANALEQAWEGRKCSGGDIDRKHEGDMANAAGQIRDAILARAKEVEKP